MASYYWIKLWVDLLSDPKMGPLPDRLWRRAIEVFLVARAFGPGDGYLPELSKVAWLLHLPEQELREDLRELRDRTDEHGQKAGIVQWLDKGWFVTNLAKRQAPVSSTKRSERHRQEGQEKDRSWRMKLYADLPEHPGAYRIVCTVNGASYTGVSKNVKKRVKAHLTDIRGRDHPLHQDFKEHGPDALDVEVLELAEFEADLDALEQKWLDRRDELSKNREARSKVHRDWTQRTGGGDGTNSSLEAEAEADTEAEAEEDVEAEADPGIAADILFEECRSLLEQIGVDEPKRSELARQSHIMPKYIKEWWAFIGDWNKPDIAVSSLISRLEERRQVPPDWRNRE